MSKVAITGDTSGTGVFTVASPNSNTDRTLTLPDESGTVIVDESNSGAVKVTSAGNVGIGTSSPASKLHIKANSNSETDYPLTIENLADSLDLGIGAYGFSNTIGVSQGSDFKYNVGRNHIFQSDSVEHMRIDTSGNLLVGKTSNDFATAGAIIRPDGDTLLTRSGTVLTVRRNTTDGTLVDFRQDATTEGTISVSGTTVSYNGGHLSRWAQTLTPKDESLVKGTVLSNLDEMNVYVDADGNPVDNEQLNKVKVSDAEGDANVAGVFVNWDFDEDHNVDEINMAMTGDMIIRIAAGVAVSRGDLLMSAGDGTAKPQGDDIVRSKTIAKVTSTNVTCTYEDGSFCVPCVLMAC